jgi:hypothetical protein
VIRRGLQTFKWGSPAPQSLWIPRSFHFPDAGLHLNRFPDKLMPLVSTPVPRRKRHPNAVLATVLKGWR